MDNRLQQLMANGVNLPAPEQVWVDESVDLNRISSGVVLYPGTRLEGADLSIGPDCLIGEETPVTLKSCQLGRGVRLKGGYHDGAVYFDRSDVGSSAHIRPGTILEEEASCAHGVGLKQTIFLPYMVAGSLINFCDALMAGGTSRKNHSEIGSGYIHFNFTPRGDKATASLIGNVPKGVLLNQNPIFLGGQGGLIGPVSIAFGTTLAAGVMQRKDHLEENQLVYGADDFPATARPFDARMYGKVQRVLIRNLEYLGNIQALRVWYETVREHFAKEPYEKALLEGGQKNLSLIYSERVKRLDELTQRLKESSPLLEGEPLQHEQGRWCQRWPSVCEELKKLNKSTGDPSLRTKIQDALPGTNDSYLEWIRDLPFETQKDVTAWLNSIVHSYMDLYVTGEDS